MKNLILTNWRIKVVCLVLASVIWYVITEWAAPAAPRQQWPRATETTR